MKIPIDFKKISEETGVRKGNIFYSPTWKSWVIKGHPDIDLICIEPPKNTIRIENNYWVTN